MRLGGGRPGGGGCVEEGQGQGQEDRGSRGSSFRKSVTGLVRRVSQRVTRENKGGESKFRFQDLCSVSVYADRTLKSIIL